MVAASIILNTASGRGKALKQQGAVSAAFDRAGVDCTVQLTDGPRHAEELAANAVSEGVKLVIAAGGDGTVNEVANGLLQAKAGTLPTLGIIPLGSGNDIAHNIGAPSKLGEVAALAATMQSDNCDVCEIEIESAIGPIHRYFLNNAGLGFEAQINVCSKSIRRIRRLPLYFTATVKAIAQYQPVDMRVSWTDADGQAQCRQGSITMLSVANGARTGGGFRILPQAELNDQWLDLGLVPRVSKPRIFSLLIQVMRGTHIHADEVTFSRFRSLRAEAQQPFPLHVDGEVLTQQATAAAISLSPKTLSILTRFGKQP